MDERERLAGDVGAVRRALVPTFLLGVLASLDGEDELSLTQMATLYLLDADGELTLGALAERLSRSVSATSRLVDGLVRRDLVARTEHPGDRRTRVVALAADGRALLRRLERTRADAQLGLVARLADDERALVARAMALLGDAARREHADRARSGSRP